MRWTVAEFLLLGTAALFATALVMAVRLRMSPTRPSLWILGVATVVCAATAVGLAAVDNVRIPGVLWALPVIPVAVIGVLARDVRRRDRLPVAIEVPAPKAATATLGEASGDVLGDTVVARVGMPQGASSAGNLADDAVARARAHNPHTEPTELADLAYGYPGLRAAVAANPATPATVLEWLAGSRDPVVTAAIAARGSSASMRGHAT